MRTRVAAVLLTAVLGVQAQEPAYYRPFRLYPEGRLETSWLLGITKYGGESPATVSMGSLACSSATSFPSARSLRWGAA